MHRKMHYTVSGLVYFQFRRHGTTDATLVTLR